MNDNDRHVWACVCGCVTGYLYADGVFECANCGNVAEGEAKFIVDSMSEKVVVETTDQFQIVDMSSTGAAYDRMIQALKTRRDEVVGYCALFANGTYSTWFKLEGDDQCDWVQRRLDEVKDYVDAKFRNKSAIRKG